MFVLKYNFEWVTVLYRNYPSGIHITKKTTYSEVNWEFWIPQSYSAVVCTQVQTDDSKGLPQPWELLPQTLIHGAQSWKALGCSCILPRDQFPLCRDHCWEAGYSSTLASMRNGKTDSEI